MKKKLICILLAAAFVFTLTGCKSTLRPALEEYARKSNIAELDLSEMLDEENGFHFGKIKWGMTLTEAGEATESNVSSMLGYGPNDIVVYESSLLLKILGRKNDSASVSTILKQSDVYMISFVFQYNEKYPNLEMPEQKLFEEYLPKLTETFGEPDDYREETQTQERVSSLTKCYVWESETTDGKKTELQWSAAYISGADEPTLVTFGVVWYCDALLEAQEMQESAENAE